MILTPRDWQAIAQREASDLLGTPEGAAKIAEAKRYGALADEIERLREVLIMAVTQNDCGMLMTGAELRDCKTALTTAKHG